MSHVDFLEGRMRHAGRRGKRVRQRFCALILWMGAAMPVIAQRTAEFSDPSDEKGSVPAVGIILFFVVLWAIGAKNGPLREWAEEHNVLASALLIGIPFIGATVLG